MSLLKYKNAKKLHLALFSEEYDSMDDSYADSCDRNSGKNPMNQEYQAKVNRKRELLEVSPLSSGGLSADESAMEFCIKEIQASNLSTPLETNVKLASDSSSFVINEALRALYEKRTEPKDQLLVILYH